MNEDSALAAEIRHMRADVQRLIDQQVLYVTQEQRTADARIFELRLAAEATARGEVAKDLADATARMAAMSRWVWSAVIGPVIVGVVLYFLIGGKP